MSRRFLFAAATLASSFACLPAQEKSHLELDSPFASFVEESFPFFTYTLDARTFGDQPESLNLVPRAIIFPLGSGHFAAYDPDLLRWALIWKANEEGEYLTMNSMASGSYRLPNRKANPGQKTLPVPLGSPLFSSPLLPGVWVGDAPASTDPRDPGPSDQGELGLGPIPAEIGRFSGIRITGDGAVIEYTAGGYQVSERLQVTGQEGSIQLRRHVEIKGEGNDFHLQQLDAQDASRLIQQPATVVEEYALVQAEGSPVLRLNSLEEAPAIPVSPPSERLWPETVTVKNEVSTASGTLVFDTLGLPVTNPWKRNVRLSGMDFFPDGRAVFCTFDGDVWIVSHLEDGNQESQWTRFASGLHEPQSLRVVDGVIHVFDLNGIIRLTDTDGNGEADWYENFSNVFAQSAETREFAMDMVVAADGSFCLAKGGQVATTRGKLSGTVIRVSPDGREYSVVASGLRQPYLGYDPVTDILTASDQQGNWRPATPVYRIRQDGYYGFQAEILKDKPEHPAPIDAPEIWIPHFTNPSSAAMVWSRDTSGSPALLAPYNDSLLLLGYNRPELFKVYLSEDSGQAAVATLLSGFSCGLLKGQMNPVDGLLYTCGFEIWGSSGRTISALYRVRSTGQPSWIPNRIVGGEKGVLLSFDQELSEEQAAEMGRYSVDRWNYQQTHVYGSGNYKLDGTPGQESLPVASAKLSADKKSLFLGIPDMKPVHSLRVTYRAPHPETAEVHSVYLTLHQLKELKLSEEGFDSDEVDLTITPEQIQMSTVEPTAELGKEVSLRYGCVACHAITPPGADAANMATSADGAVQVAVGPSWVGLWASKRDFSDGSSLLKVDETYLKESILDPGRRVTAGFEMEKSGVGMPSYLGVLKDHEVDSIILFIQSLKTEKKK